MTKAKRSWILQTDLSHADAGNQRVFLSREERVSPNSEIGSGDFVYLWSRKTREICGWGIAEGEPVQAVAPQGGLQLNLTVSPMGKGSGDASMLQFKVSIKPQILFGASASLKTEQVLKVIGAENYQRLAKDLYQIIELSSRQVYELNDLILKNGSTPPIEPLTVNSQSSNPSVAQDLSIIQNSEEQLRPKVEEEINAAPSIDTPEVRARLLFGVGQQQAENLLYKDAVGTFQSALAAALSSENQQFKGEWVSKINNELYELNVKIINTEPNAGSKPDPTMEVSGANTVGTSESVASETIAQTPADEIEIADGKIRLAGFSADIYTDKDLLGIEDDVEAFAQLIAARSIDPPLSIGLFGDWGSGKTFFMRHLRKRVEEIARVSELSHEAQKDIAFYKRIVQIEFNAWHYSESNLWASLVEHIFQNLRINKDDDEKTVKERQEALLKKLEVENAAQLHALAKEKEAAEKLEQKEVELNAVETQHGEELKQLEQVSGEDIISSVRTSLELTPAVKVQINNALIATGVHSVSEAAGDFQDALSQASANLNRAGNLASLLTRSKNQPRRLVMLIVILFAAALIGIAVGFLAKQFNLSEFLAPFSAIGTLLTTVAVWIRKQSEWVALWVGRVERVKQEVDKKIDTEIAAKKAEQEKKIATHRQELELLRTKYNALRREREEAQRRVDEIREEIRQSTAAQLLGKFIQDRASSDDYRKHLGLLALIRRDFEKLSGLLDEDNKSLKEMDWTKEQEDEKNRINRIVLYIDDLDRCQPRQVVAVLQAVHLLLAFKLFIVVVGVDCRWVTQSLRKYYPELLRDNLQVKEKNGNSEKPAEEKSPAFQTASSRDYLEKIFQIPFWLTPMTPASTIKLLNGMLESSIVKETIIQTPAREILSTNVQQVHDKQESADENTTTRVVDSEPEGQQTVQLDVQETPSKPVSLVKFDLNPKSLELRERELKYMESLAPILGRSPRSVKRFVNIYRLIKVGLSPQQQAEFLKVESPISQFQAVMLLLVIETGLHSLSIDLLKILQDDQYLLAGGRDFHSTLHQIGLENPDGQAAIDRLYKCLSSLETIKGNLPLKHFSRWAPLISKYSFNTERT